ncbi:MAG: cupin domain-containing protein, partial [Candidatus Schmidhempelia sp.]|nr:cupin domain-containing protein [Candidatus Schmidhempelia sp.]
VICGDVIAIDSNNNYLRSEDKLIATVGINNLAVIETKDAVLVMDKAQSQNVKKVVDELKRLNRKEYLIHRQVFRPWGAYDSLDKGKRYHVKNIRVKPGEKLSLQMHYHRAEHWVVVSGTAEVVIDDKIQYITENQSVYIPLGAKHSLANPGKIDLEIIEVQSGSYLEEDDIVRFQDRYGRIENEHK